MGRGPRSEEKLKLGKLKAEMLVARREATAKDRSQIRQGTDSPWRKSAVRRQKSDERRTDGRREMGTTRPRDYRTTRLQDYGTK